MQTVQRCLWIVTAGTLIGCADDGQPASADVEVAQQEKNSPAEKPDSPRPERADRSSFGGNPLDGKSVPELIAILEDPNSPLRSTAARGWARLLTLEGMRLG